VAGPAQLRIPSEIAAQLVFEAPAATSTPATWNAHLPKLTADQYNFYVNYSFETPETAPRYSAVLVRARAGGAWREAARFRYQHQPLGMVMDRAGALHVAFDCLQLAPGMDGLCFQGGASSAGLASRFYHLVFSARNNSNELRFDTYANHSEWTAQSNGYIGIAVAPNDTVEWSLADSGWRRHVQRFRSVPQPAGPVLTALPRYLLYPINAWTSEFGLMFVGEFDPAGGNNAGYPASTLYATRAGESASVLRILPDAPVAAGEVGVFPSDLDVARDDTIYALAYVKSGMVDHCTKLFRIERGLLFGARANASEFAMGCLDSYAQLQLVDEQTLVVLSAANGHNVRLGWSTDRGATWEWRTVPITGINPADIAINSWTLLDDRNSPREFRADRIAMVFTGVQAGNSFRRMYFAEFALR
jgi:hypothetical protein